jgi:hypothetical protein
MRSTWMPVALSSTSLTLLSPKSSICERVSTLIDCGVSLSDRSSRVAVLAARAV